MRHDFFQRIYKLKVTLIALVTAVAGVALLMLDKWSRSSGTEWLASLPIGELGSTLFITGAFVIVWDYVDGRDGEKRQDARLRRLLSESAPAFRDAVVRGFAVEPDDLKRVATPELLDSIATNALALRLGDRDFASEVYTDVRDQAIRAPTRWHDMDMSIRVSEGAVSAANPTPYFIVTIRREYTTIPTSPVHRFACVSDRAEYLDLLSETPVTSAWYMTPRPGFDAGDKDAFELLEYSIDGVPSSIRRTAQKAGQTYTAKIPEDVVVAGKPVRVSYLYRTITPQSGHLLYFDIEQPTRNISLDLDYSDSRIDSVSVLDLIASGRRTRITRSPKDLPGRTIRVAFDGWMFPRTGIAFVWALVSEVQIPGKPTVASARR